MTGLPLFDSPHIPQFGEWPTYKAGPTIKDLAKTHDIKLRVARNLKPRLPVEARAMAGIEKHPDGEGMVDSFASQALNAGRTKLGSKAILERLRWESYLMKDKGFKVNNICGALLARRFMTKYPQYGKVFETREKA